MFVKIMSSIDQADKDQSKCYSIYDCSGVVFKVLEDKGPVAILEHELGSTELIPVPGNVYVLNNNGDTIDCWAPNSGGPVKHLLTEGVDPNLLISKGS